jgi:hypothetical protein
MSLLTICQSVARSIGIAAPTTVAGSTDRTNTVLLSLANETGEELARRVDWGELTAAQTLTGDGTNKIHALTGGFSRVVRGIGVTGTGGIVRPLSRAEWASLDAVEGDPRYFLLEKANMTLWPYLANAATLTVYYQTENWCDNGTAAFASDDDAPLMDEELFAKGLEVRWRRAHGMEYSDQEAEYEAALQDLAGFNGRSRL